MPARAFHHRLLLLLLALSLSACGFRLAGSYNPPALVDSLSMVTSQFNRQQRLALEKSLDSAGIRVVEQADADLPVLTVGFKPIHEPIVAFSGSGTSLLQITRQLSFGLKSSSGEVLLQSSTLRRQKNIELDSNQLLSSVAEQASVAEKLESDLYDQLIRSLNRL